MQGVQGSLAAVTGVIGELVDKGDRASERKEPTAYSRQPTVKNWQEWEKEKRGQRRGRRSPPNFSYLLIVSSTTWMNFVANSMACRASASEMMPGVS